MSLIFALYGRRLHNEKIYKLFFYYIKFFLGNRGSGMLPLAPFFYFPFHVNLLNCIEYPFACNFPLEYVKVGNVL